MRKGVGISVHPYTRYAENSFTEDLEEVSSSNYVGEMYAVTSEGRRNCIVGEGYFDGFLDDYNGHGGLTSSELEEISEYDTAYVFGFYFHDCVPGATESLMEEGFDTVVLEEHSYTSEGDNLYSLDQVDELEDSESLLRNLYTVAPETLASI